MSETGLSTVVAPNGYRLLVDGETIRKGDLYAQNGAWCKSAKSGCKWKAGKSWPMARPVATTLQGVK